MHLEEPRQQHARRIGQVRARSTLDLRQIGLAQSAAQLFFERHGEVLLRHFSFHAAQRAFDQAQVAEFFAEFHITISNYNIAICNVKNWIWFVIREFGSKAQQVFGRSKPRGSSPSWCSAPRVLRRSFPLMWQSISSVTEARAHLQHALPIRDCIYNMNES